MKELSEITIIELLDIVNNIPVNGDASTIFQQIANILANKWISSDIYLLVLKPFTGTDDKDRIFDLFYSNPNVLDSTTKSTAKVIFTKSILLQNLHKNRFSNLDLTKDNYLSKCIFDLKNIHSTPKTKLQGAVLLNLDIPMGFVLTNQKDKNVFKTNEWQIINRILKLGIDKLFFLYQEKNDLHKTFGMIADNLQSIFPKIQTGQADVLQSVIDCTRAFLDVQKCALFLVDSSKSSLVLERASGDINFEKLRDVATYNIMNYNPDEKGTGVTPWVLFRKKPFNARNFQELKEHSENHWKGNWDKPMYGEEKAESLFQNVYMVPLWAGDQPIGVLKYENKLTGNKFFDQSDERIIDMIGELVTNLVISQRIERNIHDYALPKISTTLVSYFGQPIFYEKLLDKCCEILNAEICSLFLVENNYNLMLKAIVGVPDDVKEKLRHFSYGDYRTAKGLTPWILRRRNSFNVRTYPDLIARSEGNHTGKWDKLLYNDEPGVGFKSLYSIPLIIGEEIIGVFKVENKKSSPYYFTESDERMFDLIGRLIAIGVKYDYEQYLGLTLRAAELGFIASGIAHQFNNDLYLFMSIANNIEKYKLNNEDVLQRVETLKIAINKASKTIESFKNIKERRQNVEQFNIDNLIDQIIHLTKERFQNHNITFRYSNNDKLENVVLNPSEVQSILVNLLNNSLESILESNKTGSIELNVKSHGFEDFSIEVVDNGRGISDEEKKHLFMPFYPTKKVKGMGIGLFWVHRLIKGMEGEIQLHSPNKLGGATFKVILPRVIRNNGDIHD